MNPNEQLEIQRKLALIEELDTSIKLIRLGFGEFQNLGAANDFYHLPFQLISSGFERLMKCHICLGHIEQNGIYPDPKLFKNKLGHDLNKIKEHILENYFKVDDFPILKKDKSDLSENPEINTLVSLLSEFGKFARYYNLDVITGQTNAIVDVKSLWQEFETNLILKDADLLAKFGDLETQREAIDENNRDIIILLERFVRAISRQFTFGKLGSQALQLSTTLFDFIKLTDNELGTTDYRKSTISYKERDRYPQKRTLSDEIERETNNSYKSQKIMKSEFKGDWPFYNDEVIIECRNKFWCVVTIDGYDYALNGAAVGRYKLENVHDAGMAILGKPVSDFTKLALELWED